MGHFESSSTIFALGKFSINNSNYINYFVKFIYVFILDDKIILKSITQKDQNIKITQSKLVMVLIEVFPS